MIDNLSMTLQKVAATLLPTINNFTHAYASAASNTGVTRDSVTALPVPYMMYGYNA